MSTPEDKLINAASSVKAEIVKVKALWQRWEPYAIAVGGFLIGFVAGHVRL
jgi:hypothetical protein